MLEFGGTMIDIEVPRTKVEVTQEDIDKGVA